MDFNPINVVPSKLFPGVTYKLNRISYGRRASFELDPATLAHRAKVREIRRERKALDDEYDEASKRAKAAAEPEVLKLVEAKMSRAEAQEKVYATLSVDMPAERFLAWSDGIAAERKADRDILGAAVIRCAFAGINGFKIKGQEPTAQELIDDGPPEMLDEMLPACYGVLGMSPEETKNWQWPGTSPQAEAGPKTVTNAEAVAIAA
jgi:hypothetical protein